jgi:glycosyltransferase involved in cell wall biosynthesis
MLYITAESLAEGAAAHVHVNEICAGLLRRGWKTRLLEPEYDKMGHDRVGYDRSAKKPGLLRRLTAILGVNYRAWRALGGVDAIYCRANPLLLPISFLARRRGIAVVHECNGPYADIAIAHPGVLPFLGLISAMQRWQYRKADGVVAVTDQLKSWIEGECGRADVALITNAANTSMFTPEVAPDRLTDRPFVVFFGALAVWHGARMMLEALAHPEWPAGVDLLIVGAGADSPIVAAAAAADPRIHYIGRQPYKRVPGLVVGALAGLVPIVDVSGRAKTGLAPLKLFETLAAGVPVIATDYPTQADFVRDNDCGLVVPPGDSAALARAIGKLARDPAAAKAMGARGRAAVERDHSWDHRAAEVDRLLRGTVRQTARTRSLVSQGDA